MATLDGHMRVNTAAAQLILPCWLGRNQPLNRVEAGYHVGHDEEAPAGEFGLDVAANHFGEVTVFAAVRTQPATSREFVDLASDSVMLNVCWRAVLLPIAAPPIVASIRPRNALSCSGRPPIPITDR